MKKEIKFPSIIGIIFLIAALGVAVYLSSTRTSFGSKASGDCQPEIVQVTNVTARSVAVSFITSATCLATVTVGNQVISDIKTSLSTNDGPSHLHYFEVNNLKPTTLYDFSITSGGSSYVLDNSKFTTASTPSSATPSSNLAWGKVLAQDGKTPGIAIVYLNIPGAAPLSSVVTSNGNWSISLANSFNESKTDWFVTPSDSLPEDIIVISEDEVTTQISHSTNNNNPVPNIIIGTNSLEPAQVNTPSPAVGQLDGITPVQTQKKISIINPTDGEMISVGQPQFFGSGPANAQIIVEVHSDQAINGVTNSSNSGDWSWSPPTNLSPGPHTITVKVQQPSGLWDTVTKNFTVLAAESSIPQYQASASATLTPSIIPTAIPTERTIIPSTTIKPPVTGAITPTILIIVGSLLFFAISVKLLL